MSSIAEELSGAEVYQVVFVRDYVQFGLHSDAGDVGITAVTDPEILIGGRTFRRGDAGWRDALCELIGSRVLATSVSDDEFRVDFDADAVLTVSLLGNEYSPEAVQVVGKGTWILNSN